MRNEWHLHSRFKLLHFKGWPSSDLNEGWEIQLMWTRMRNHEWTNTSQIDYIIFSELNAHLNIVVIIRPPHWWNKPRIGCQIIPPCHPKIKLYVNLYSPLVWKGLWATTVLTATLISHVWSYHMPWMRATGNWHCWPQWLDFKGKAGPINKYSFNARLYRKKSLKGYLL